jgi:hypothetical protein
MSNEIFRIGDKISYTGSRYKDKLGGKAGWIHAPVINQPGTWVVEFPDTRNNKDQNDTDDYVMPEKHLTKWHPSAAELKKIEGPEIQPRRRKKDPEEE